MASAILASRNETCWGERKVYMRKYTNTTTSNKNPLLKLNPNPTPYPNPNPTRQIHYLDNQDDHHRHQQQQPPPPVAVSDDSPSPKRRSISLNEAKDSSRAGHVTFNLGAYTRRELKELKKRLISELDQVRILKNRIESTNFDARPGPGPVYPSTIRQPPPPSHPLQQLNYVTDSPPKAAADAKPTPKSDLGKKKKGPGSKRVNPFPDPNRKRPALEPATEQLVSSMMKRCGQILSKLMKHKHGWVFNTPVDAVAMGLHDYHQVIKNPMDLGTVKVNLDKDLYESPLDFASDVRLTFNNALTYNPKGHDVYAMAEMLYKKFEEMFNPAYKKFEDEKRRVLRNLAVVVVEEEEPRIWQQPPPPPPPSKGPEPISIAKRLDSVNPVPLKAVVEVEVAPPPREVVGVGKSVVTTPTPRSGKLPKPKAKDPNKRLMSLEEKARLGMNLQDLPLEKTAQLVNIIRKRNGHLAQDGDEIELDIETIDNETLWELDRFVCNYKKMVSKIKRQGLLQNPMMGAHVNKSPVSEMAEAEVAQKGKKGDVGEEDVDIGEEIPMGNFPSVEIEKDDATACASSSSSSSSSSSDSSSSDSDSGSSSGSDSDADSVRTPFVESKEAH